MVYGITKLGVLIVPGIVASLPYGIRLSCVVCGIVITTVLSTSILHVLFLQCKKLSISHSDIHHTIYTH